jgi:hypothetical protein
MADYFEDQENIQRDSLLSVNINKELKKQFST